MLQKEVYEVSFVSCSTSYFGPRSFLESVEHDFEKAMKIQTGN